MSQILKCITLAVVMLLIVTACGPNRSKEDIDKALNKDNSKKIMDQSYDVGGWRQANGVL